MWRGDTCLDITKHITNELPIKKTRKVNSFSLANIQEIRNLKEQGFKNKDLCIKFRIAKSTLSQIINKKGDYKNV